MDAIGTARVAIGTRFFATDPKKAKVIEDFVQMARSVGEIVLVAVNAEEDRTDTLNNPKIKGEGIEVFPVTPWGKFVQPLNALVLKAKSLGISYFLSASAEMAFTREQIQDLFNHMGEETLVVGAALEGHDLKTGKIIGNGRTVPWNTMALCNLKYLARIGFALIGDNPSDPENAGVEELATIAVLQRLYSIEAKLVAVPGVKWQTENFDPGRREEHEKKMWSKITRPQKQIEILNIPAPTIIHIP